MRKNAGITFPFFSDTDILDINSPRKRIHGPWYVIARGTSRWALVALNWDDRPALGIRWFYGPSGTPISSSYATWFIVPDDLQNILLKGLNLSKDITTEVENFLAGTISGQELQNKLTHK